MLRAHHVKYRTRLIEADKLLRGYQAVPVCRSGAADGIAGLWKNVNCPLALVGLLREIYEREWDVVMIDAPKGYFAMAPEADGGSLHGDCDDVRATWGG
ncbi:putative methyltransferase [Canna indica]|uniref:Methyltransferase n=1 Tax=Canna indica TaxID=4628 RepID=A0AAQ3QD36_9LILI|nr:putative methyltransferase [Canna indica]